MKHRTLKSSLLAALLLPALASTATAQQERPARPEQPAQPAQDPKRAKLSEWPSLKKTETDRVRALAKQFRKPQEKLRDAAVEKLVKMGAGVAPVLIRSVNDRPENANAYVFAVLDRVTDGRHAALLARESKRNSVEWRRYLTRKLASLRDPEMEPVLEATREDKDPDIAFYAALGLLALGETSGLDTVLAAARQRWAATRDLIAATLEPARSAEISMKVWTRIGQARPTEQMAGLRLLRHLAVKEQRVLLRSYLESADFAVKREAINTVRMLHGEKPLEKLSSFQAINLAKEWLQKL